MNNTELSFLVDRLYNEFISDESIIGFKELMESKGLGSKRRIKLRRIIYDKYGEEKLKKIYRQRLAKLGGLSRKDYKHSKETIEKIRKSNIESWKNNRAGKDRARELMKQYCLPNCQTEESKIKRVESRKWYKHSIETIEKIKNSNKGRKLTDEHKSKLRKPKKTKRIGFYHSKNTKEKLSRITKLQWKNGIHKPKYKSKGHIEIIKILNELGYKVEDEYIIDGKPFDVFIKDKNLLIEFNGTYWHRDPRCDKYKNDPMCEIIWNKDKEKVDLAINRAYNVKVIWQSDWEECKNKIEYIKKLLC